MRHSHLVRTLCLVLGLAGCGPAARPPAAAPPPPAPKPVASVQELMTGMLVPASDAVWKLPPSIAEPDSKARPEQLAADWNKVEAGAVVLAEAANLLAMEGRAAARPGGKLLDEGAEGNLPRDQIEARMKADRPDFLKHALALQAAALKTRDAALARNADELILVGGEIDEACEACHKQFWYPAPTAQPNK